jgi:hypothetical protein
VDGVGHARGRRAARGRERERAAAQVCGGLRGLGRDRLAPPLGLGVRFELLRRGRSRGRELVDAAGGGPRRRGLGRGGVPRGEPPQRLAPLLGLVALALREARLPPVALDLAGRLAERGARLGQRRGRAAQRRRRLAGAAKLAVVRAVPVLTLRAGARLEPLLLPQERPQLQVSVAERAACAGAAERGGDERAALGRGAARLERPQPVAKQSLL